jgi:integrase/recombinase XerD
MQKTEQPFINSEANISVSELPFHVECWLNDCRASQHSARTIEARRLAMNKFLWYLREFQHEECDVSALRGFCAYLATAHEDPRGRWANSQQKQPLAAVTVQTYHKHLRAFFNYLVRDEAISLSPMRKIPRVVARPDQIQPFSDEELKALLKAAKTTKNHHRDEALIWFMLDTGMRASEICHLKMSEVDFKERCCSIKGKGNKRRLVCFSIKTKHVLWRYLKQEGRRQDEYVFLAQRGPNAGEPLTRSGLFQLIQRLGERAAIKASRCSPHTFRHTFAVRMLRNGADSLSVKAMLGHNSLHMTNRYVAFTQADVKNQHLQFSPTAGLLLD